MSLTTREYNIIWETNQEEANRVIRQERIDKMTLYLDQSEEVLIHTANLTDAQLSDPQLYIESLPPLDEQLESYNAPNEQAFLKTGTILVVLGFTQTQRYAPTYEFGLELIDPVVQSFTEPVNNFRLSEALWGVDKRDPIYQFTVKQIQQNKPKGMIIAELEDYLQGGKGGAYYRAERLVDTETQRYYFNGNLNTMRDYNSKNTPKMLFNRELSPVHAVKDICDSLVGTYDTEELVPAIPSHPFCLCLLRRIFEDDYRGKTKKLDFKGTEYVDQTYGQTQLMV